MKKWALRFGWMALGIAALYGASAMAGVVSGGSLDPPGPVGSTMKSLADIAPSWHRILDSSDGDVNNCNSTRFTCVFGDQAALDNETGIVWLRELGFLSAATQAEAIDGCPTLVVQGRAGWRLPTFTELRTLLYLDSPPGNQLPAGHPFLGSDSLPILWSSTRTASADAPLAMGIDGSFVGGTPETTWNYTCIRSPEQTRP